MACVCWFSLRIDWKAVRWQLASPGIIWIINCHQNEDQSDQSQCSGSTRGSPCLLPKCLWERMDLWTQVDSYFVVFLFSCFFVFLRTCDWSWMDLQAQVDSCFNRNAKLWLVVVNFGRYHLLFSFLLSVKVLGKIPKSIILLLGCKNPFLAYDNDDDNDITQVEQHHEHGTVCKQSDWPACYQLGCKS